MLQFSFNPDQSMDALALQRLYGAAPHDDGAVYDLALPMFQNGSHAIFGSGGIDMLDASGVANAVVLDLHQDARSEVGAGGFAFSRPPEGSNAIISYTGTLTIGKGSEIENATGSAYDDLLIGNDGNNTLRGGGGNDTLIGGGRNDILDGGCGIDTAAFSRTRADYSVRMEDGKFVVADTSGGGDGRATLIDVERLAFIDRTVALDLDGNAGTAVKIVGALAGKAGVHDANLVGVALAGLDAGASSQQVAADMIKNVFGHAPSDEEFVQLVFRNLLGFSPTDAKTQGLADLIHTGTVTQASFTTIVAEMDLNKQSIDFAGLSHTGVDYTPYA